MSDVRQAGDITVGTVILRLYYGAWREMRVSAVDRDTNGHVTLWAGNPSGDGPTIPIGPMKTDTLVKVSAGGQ